MSLQLADAGQIALGLGARAKVAILSPARRGFTPCLRRLWEHAAELRAMRQLIQQAQSPRILHAVWPEVERALRRHDRIAISVDLAGLLHGVKPSHAGERWLLCL